MRLVKFEIKPNSKCPVMRLLVLIISLVSLVTPARAVKPAARPSSFPSGSGLTTQRASSTRLPQSRCRGGCPLLAPGFGPAPLAPPPLRGRLRGRLGLPEMLVDDGVGGGSLPDRVLILGAGWVGSRLAKRLADAGSRVAVTNRPTNTEKVKPLYFRPVKMPTKVKPRVLFEINDKETWANLPPASEFDAVVVTFPLSSANCEAFYDEYLSGAANVVCYSSTSIYQVDTPGQQVDEHTTLKPTLRAQMEGHYLDHGATILTISGIFGEPRGPRGVCACLTAYSSAGGTLNARSNINMVHVEDILAATCACLEAPHKSRGTRLNVAGGHFQLSELVAHCKHPDLPDEGGALDYNSKIVSSERLLSEVMPEGYAFVKPL